MSPKLMSQDAPAAPSHEPRAEARPGNAAASPGPDRKDSRAPRQVIPRRRPTEGSTVVRKTTAGFTANLVQLGAAMATALLLARYLGPALLGEYYLLYTVTLTLSLFVSLGVEAANSVFVGRGEEHPGRVHAASLLLTLVMGGLAVGAAWLVFPLPELGLVDRVDRFDFLLALLTVPFILYQNLLYSILVGTGHLVLMSRMKIAVAAIRFAGDLSMIALGLGVRGLIASFLVCSAAGALFLLLASLPVARPHARFRPSLLGKLAGFGVRSHLGTIAGQLHFRADTFILNALHGTASVGIYSVAVQAAELPWLFFGAIQNAVFARVSAANRQEAHRQVSFLLRLGLLLWAALVLIGITLVPPLMLWLLGPEYAPSGQAFSLLIAGTAAVGVARLTAPYFLGQLRRPGLLSALAWLNVGANVVLCLALIPACGVNGAALASLISYTGGLVALLWFYGRLSGERPSRFLVPQKGDLRLLVEALRSLRRRR